MNFLFFYSTHLSQTKKTLIYISIYTIQLNANVKKAWIAHEVRIPYKVEQDLHANK